MHMPRNFALQLGALICLYVSIGSIIALLFGLINLSFPDAAYYWEAQSATDSIRFSLAMLVVFFPAYIVLTRIVNKLRRADVEGAYLSVTKWLVYLSLLIAGGVLLGDLVSVIYTFLNGEITVRFILKVLVILLWLGLAFYYYLKDVQGYWVTHEKESKLFGLATIIAVAVIVVLGFLNIETPEAVREMRIDDAQVSDLQSIHYQIQEYYFVQGALPANLEEAYGDLPIPAAPEDRAPYTYEIETDTTYTLCANFVHSSPEDAYNRIAVPITEKNYNWQHKEGNWCFERVVEQQVKLPIE